MLAAGKKFSAAIPHFSGRTRPYKTLRNCEKFFIWLHFYKNSVQSNIKKEFSNSICAEKAKWRLKMIFHIKTNIKKIITGITLTAMLLTNTAFTGTFAPGAATVRAEKTYLEKMEERKTLPIQSNSIPNWPQGPAVGAQSAILMELNTHTILYAKNIDEKNYPASTTKILTCLLAMQNCAMNETITFSRDAIYDVPADGSRLGGVDTGDTMLMENALYSVLVLSANDVASAVGEHVAEKLTGEKTVAAFSELMNKKAKELGCKNTHFSNCNGLYADDHYTTAYDLALIGCEFFANEMLCKMSSMPSYHFKLKPEDEDDAWMTTKNQLYKGKPYEYPYLLGSKTGFVSQSRQTLVSAAEKNGLKLVCVILTDETPYQFEDTITLFQYGFENFKRVSINGNETNYNVDTMDFFDTEDDLFGDSTPLISMEPDAYIVLPNTAEFADASPSLTYAENTDSTNVIATIGYTYSDVNVGSCDLVFYKTDTPALSFSTSNAEPESSEETAGTEAFTSDAQDGEETNIIYVNVKIVVIGIIAAVAVIGIIIFIISIINNYSFSPRGQSSRRRRMRRRESRAAKRQARRNARKNKSYWWKRGRR